MPPSVVTENAAGTGAASTGAASSGNITSGTASEAMIAAATAASSAEAQPAGETAGDTSTAAGAAAGSGATSGATGQPQTTGPATTAVASADAPENRIIAAVKNARAEVESRFAWAKDLNPEDAKAGLNLLASIRRDPRAFWQELGTRLGAAPTEEAEEALPDADLISADGKLKTYSDTTIKQMLDVHGRSVMKRLMGELRPLIDFYGSETKNREQQTIVQNSRAMAGQALAEARKMPHFVDNEPAITEKLQAMDPNVRRSVGAIAAMYMAYNQVLAEKVFPTIDSAAETRVREANAKKAAASRGSAHPVDQGGEGAAQPLRNVSDLAKHMERLSAG